jgi:hypothetical protein
MLQTGRLGRVHFRLEKQVTHIQSHGQQCSVWPVLQCPCLLDDKQFSPICPTCHGTGRYYPPVAQYSTMLLLSQETSQRTFNDPGTWTSGTMQASVLPGVRLCERDKVQLLDIRDSFTDEVLTRGLDDTTRFDAGVVLEVVADHDRTYRPGFDYVLTAPNVVEWLAGGQMPAFGAQYSVKYSAFPVYLVVNDSPRLRVEHRIPQAQEVVLCRLDRLSEDF